MKQLFFGLLFAMALAGNAQTSKQEVLFTVDDKPFYSDEFLRIYKKNINLVKDDSQKDLNQYLDLYTGYKMKICKANKLGLQDSPKFQAELKSYRNQLAKNYLTDTKVTKELLDEAYARSKKEVNASHILIMVDENASPADTLKAYNQMLTIRKRAVAGEDFGKLAVEFSQDPSAKENKGELGYFSVFRMLYPFESGAYKTPKGGISNPVRTKFGYHLIKVNDVRDNRGEVTVAHIMIMASKEASQNDNAKATIDMVYKKLQQGEDFAALAQQFSEDKSTAGKGGILNKFSAGQLSSSIFEDKAFSLVNPNDITEPFKSEFGYHIIKLISKHPLKTMEEMQPELESKIKKDDRSKLIAHSMNDKLRKMYPFKRNEKLYASVVKTVTKDFYAHTWKVPFKTKPYEQNLFVVNKDKKVSGVDFLNYLAAQQNSVGDSKVALNKLVAKFYEKFVDEQLNVYYNDNLERQFPEFANVMSEYRDGLLLFDLMEKEIWNRSKSDTIGIQKFYEANKNQYRWKNRLDVNVLSSTNEKAIKKAFKMLKKGKTWGDINKKLNTKEKVEIANKEGVYEVGNTAIPENVQMQEGVYDAVLKNKYYYVTKVNKVIPEDFKKLEECKGKVINDYQQYLEDNWVNELRKEFTVKVDSTVFEKVKREI